MRIVNSSGITALGTLCVLVPRGFQCSRTLRSRVPQGLQHLKRACCDLVVDHNVLEPPGESLRDYIVSQTDRCNSARRCGGCPLGLQSYSPWQLSLPLTKLQNISTVISSRITRFPTVAVNNSSRITMWSEFGAGS